MISAEELFNVDSVESQPVFKMPVYRETELTHPILRQAGDAIVELMRAQRCLRFAESWRDFRVACCAVTFFDDDLTVSILHGVNKKPELNGPTDVHAEEYALQEAINMAREPLTVVTVVADVQPDHTTGLNAPTLTPCFRRCLPALEKSEVVVPETLIFNANPNLTCVQYYDVTSLRKAYESNNPDLLNTVTLETPDGSDHAEWREKIAYPILRRAQEMIDCFMQEHFLTLKKNNIVTKTTNVVSLPLDRNGVGAVC